MEANFIGEQIVEIPGLLRPNVLSYEVGLISYFDTSCVILAKEENDPFSAYSYLIKYTLKGKHRWTTVIVNGNDTLKIQTIFKSNDSKIFALCKTTYLNSYFIYEIYPDGTYQLLNTFNLGGSLVVGNIIPIKDGGYILLRQIRFQSKINPKTNCACLIKFRSNFEIEQLFIHLCDKYEPIFSDFYQNPDYSFTICGYAGAYPYCGKYRNIIVSVEDNTIEITTNKETIIAKDFLPIDNNQNQKVQIYSILGSLIGEYEPNEFIYVGNLPAGVYFLKQNNKIVKFIKLPD